MPDLDENLTETEPKSKVVGNAAKSYAFGNPLILPLSAYDSRLKDGFKEVFLVNCDGWKFLEMYTIDFNNQGFQN